MPGFPTKYIMNTIYALFENPKYGDEEYPVLLGIFNEFHLMEVYRESLGSLDKTFYEELEFNVPIYG